MLLRISSAVFVHTAFQIRPTVDFDSPDRFAIDARDQWVASSVGTSEPTSHAPHRTVTVPPWGDHVQPYARVFTSRVTIVIQRYLN